ncbi:MotA/TolQ/ExbB proton channel family protein [Vibrio sp.]|nr:MotA/TolQ/ExbB proton channel family protein [Vibrio sp.]
MSAFLNIDYLSVLPDSLAAFMQEGGTIVWWLALTVFFFWVLVLERCYYLFVVFPKHKAHFIALWHQREERSSWIANAIREGWISDIHLALYKHLNLVKLLVSLFPMLGLLGTVTGMIAVFDIMALENSSNPKVMASGISMATLPTLAGMVAAVVGLFMHSRITKACRTRELKFEQALRRRQ